MDIMNIKTYRNLIYKGTNIIDPFSESEVLVNRRWIAKYFLDRYNLTLSQVWNLANGFSKDQEHYCIQCGAKLEFKRLSRGFGSFCSASCNMLYQWETNPNTDSYLKSCRSNDSNYGWNSVRSTAESCYTRFLNKGDINDQCIFYFALLKSNEYPYKFGVTIDIWNRANAYYSEFLSIHKVFIASRKLVASLERDLKIYLNQNHEYFNESNINKIKDYIRSYEVR